MSVNRYAPHILVLPEDDANRQLARGFLLNAYVVARNIQVLNEAGGWMKVLERFNTDEVRDMESYPQRYMILLIDFDGQPERLPLAKSHVPSHLQDRVFILGVLSEPEALRQANLGSLEKIGQAMAQDCYDETDSIWGHSLLQHNSTELERLRQSVRPILF